MKTLKTIIIVIAVLIGIGLLELLNFAITGPMSNKSVSTEELIGKYSVPLPEGGREILELLPEGVCKQDIFLKDGRIFNAIGEWRLDKDSNFNNELMLKKVRDSLNMFGNKINPNIAEISNNAEWGLPIFRTLMGHIKIGLYGDLGEYYRKIEK